MSTRTIIHIDEDKCNGCGLCIPNCAEGAIKIIDGKARLVSDNLCDGIGACLGHCPQGALTLLEREADAFDVEAVDAHLGTAQANSQQGGCPGSRAMSLQAEQPAANANAFEAQPSELRQWPVQLALVPTRAPFFQGADLLLAATCVPFAYPDFHRQLLRGKTVLVACPKLDDVGPYVEKLALIFSENDIHSITIARMTVPCCGGLKRLVDAALALVGRDDIPVHTLTIDMQGQIQK